MHSNMKLLLHISWLEDARGRFDLDPMTISWKTASVLLGLSKSGQEQYAYEKAESTTCK
jgi:hypothetical protein